MNEERPGTARPDTAEALPALQRLDTLLAEVREDLDLVVLTTHLRDALGLNVSDSVLSISGVLNQELTVPQQRLVAATFLRLLHSRADCWQQAECRLNALKFLDRMPEELYRRCRIGAKDQNHEIEPKLSEFVDQVESELQTIIDAVGNLDLIGQARNRALKTLNDHANEILLRPFLPEHLLDTRLQEIFVAAEEYVDASDNEVFSLYRRAISAVDEFETEAAMYNTEYSRRLLLGLCASLSEALTAHFMSSPVSKPAIIRIESSGKKYPLSTPGQPVGVRLALRNDGPGHAFEAMVSLTDDGSISLERSETYLGDISPGLIELEVMGMVRQASTETLLDVTCTWKNFDGSEATRNELLTLERQSTNVDWDSLRLEDPYALEPISREDELVGREDILSELEASLGGKTVTSCYIHGQKRVGKTSLVKTLQTRLTKSENATFVPVYLEEGQYDLGDAARTLDDLVEKLCSLIGKSDRRISHIAIPPKKGALSALNEFLDEVIEVAPELRLVVILDEFDEMPRELFDEGPLAKSFFQSLRAISSKPFVGFLLVGGEKLEPLIKWNWVALNKFRPVSVGYFDRKKQWSDFEELVRRPVSEWLDISDEAVVALYQQTAGHPYFTKLVCGPLFQLMVERRDAHVTKREAIEAIELTVQRIERNSFEHFWVDGIIATGTDRRSFIITRQKVLIAITELIRRGDAVTRSSILSEGGRWLLSETSLEQELVEFVRREVLVMQGETYQFKVPLFADWLVQRGAEDLAGDFVHEDAVLKEYLASQERYRVKSAEIVGLVQRWGTYKGRSLGVDSVRAWLDQFKDVRDERLMFKLLENVRFYNQAMIREKLSEAHQRVIRGLRQRIEKRQRKRKDILVSYPGGEGKSGATYARLYADENDIWYDNVVNLNTLVKRLEEDKEIQAIVFVDDFVGTGQSASSFLDELNARVDETLRPLPKLMLVAIAGFKDAASRIESHAERLGFDLEVLVCDPLDASCSVFGDKSEAFADSTERTAAAKIAERAGRILEKKWPLGFGDCQATVVFDSSCPNNSLPVLWKEASGWLALFPRN